MDRVFKYNQRIMPYVRMTQRGKFVKKDALEYQASQQALAWSLKSQMGIQLMVRERLPFEIELEYHAPDIYRYDLDNLIKAVLDAAQGIVFFDDRWCQCIKRAEKIRGESYALVFVVREVEQ